ncbi:MAG TPA: hypothetical protein VIN10_14535 [Bacteroidales bacterium]
MWFEKLVGFSEENPEQVRANLIVENEHIISKINNKSYCCGTLEIPSLSSLKQKAPDLQGFSNKIKVSEVVGNVQNLHQDPDNAGAVFQVASQFNLLEMTSSGVIPEQGVGIYEHDYTQGPSCAIACGAGTIYRNYFVKIGNQIGQTRDVQIDCLDDMGSYLGNHNSELWQMRNGYALASKEGLKKITNKIKSLDNSEYEHLKGMLKVGVQWNTEVTLSEMKNKVTQVYCSALPITYSGIENEHWEVFAKLVLSATYEAAFYTALINYSKNGNGKLFLTLVGGGVFGNDKTWILEAIENAVTKFRNTPLDIRIVSYKQPDFLVNEFIRKIMST